MNPMANVFTEHLSDLLLAGLVIVVFLALGRATGYLIDRFVVRAASRTSTDLDDDIVGAIRRPISGLTLLIGVAISLKLLQFLPAQWITFASNLVFVGFIVIGYLFVYRLTRDTLAWYAANMASRTETMLDDQFIPFFRRLLLIVLSSIAAMVLMQHFGYDITAFVATLGVGSLAVALAAQSTLSDAINGFIIMIDRPFRVGDRIELLDLKTWGDVTDIGLRSTRVRTRDNRMVIVPNSAIGKSLVVNHSYPDTRYRVQTHVGVAYGTDIEKARYVMTQAVRAQDWVMRDERIDVLFLELGDSALVFRVRCWIESYTETRRVIDKLNTCLYDALNEAGIEMAFPEFVLWHRLEPDAKRNWREVVHG